MRTGPAHFIEDGQTCSRRLSAYALNAGGRLLAAVTRPDCAVQPGSEGVVILVSVYILGAGFSRAVSAHMPLTDELGNACIAAEPALASEVPGGRFIGGNFEAWLSERAEDQPYFSPAQNSASRSTYFRIIELVAKVLRDGEVDALASAAPDWLLELVELWHAERAVVITFNYDTLVEVAVQDAKLHDPHTNVIVPWSTAINFTPRGFSGATYGEIEQSAQWSTFALLKLHGSLNWFWTPGDAAGATIVRGELQGQFGNAKPFTEAERQRWFPGREPLLVPPAAAKSSYYANPIAREIWRRAYDALSTAERVTFVGYSLPVTDFAMSGMLSESLARATGMEIEVVDVSPAPVVDRIEALLPGAKVVVRGGSTPIEDMVRVRRAALLDAVPARVQAAARSAGELRVAVSWSNGAVAAALAVVRESDTCVVLLEGIGQIWFATREDRSTRSDVPGFDEREPLSASELANALEGCTRIRARLSDGSELEVFGATVRSFEGENSGHGTWLTLAPSGLGLDL